MLKTLTAPTRTRGIRTLFVSFIALAVVAMSPAVANALTTGSGSISGSSTALNRASYALTHQSEVCGGSCQYKVLKVTSWIWGYSSSGFVSANEQWSYLKSIGKAYPGNTAPPKGALVFYNVGTNGWSGVYVGNGKVEGVWPSSTIQVVNGDSISGYRGWAYPVFKGSKI